MLDQSGKGTDHPDCERIQLAVLSAPDDLCAETRRHLARCAACREFAQVQHLALAAHAPRVPSPGLDQAVLLHGRSLLAAQRRRHYVRLSVWSTLAAAAAVVCLFSMAWLLRQGGSGSGSGMLATVPSPPNAEAPLDWQEANLLLATLEKELANSLAEVNGFAEPAPYPPPVGGSSAPAGTIGSIEIGLLELECDLYLEMQHLFSDG